MGLAGLYRSPKENDPEEQRKSKWLQAIFGLPFLSPEDVGTCFIDDFISELPEGSKFTKFADYLVENYIEESSRFPPEMWASFERSNVTNNPCESFHSHFQKNFYHSHPDINSFARILVDTQTFVYVKINSVNEPPRPLCSKYKKSQQKLQDAKQQYLLGTLPRKDFVVAASKRYRK